MKTVFIICPGVEHIRRGFESRSLGLFDKLTENANSESAIYLLKGSGGPTKGHLIIPHIREDTFLSNILCRITFRHYRFYQNISFFLMSLRQFVIKRPSIIYFGDPQFYRYYNIWRRISGQSFKVVFHTGGQAVPEPLASQDVLACDTPLYVDRAKAKNIPTANIRLLPSGFSIQRDYDFLSQKEKLLERQRLNIPPNAKVIISVGALNESIKRMKYVVSEVSGLENDPFLILIGQRDIETKDVIKTANLHLKSGSFLIDSVPHSDVDQYLKIADIFVLASLSEGVGRVYIEALSHGLPVIAHDFPNAREVIGKYGFFGDLTKQKALKTLMELVLNTSITIQQKKEMRKYVYERFGWDNLLKVYKDTFGT